MWRPSGIFTEKYEQDMAICHTRMQQVLLGLALLLVFIAPLFLTEHWTGFLVIVGITVICVHGLNLLLGYGGQISLGQAAFMGFGGYCGAIMSMKLGFPFLASVLCGGIFAALVGLLFGLPSLRIKGFYLALVTLAAHFIFEFVVTHTKDISGGIYGLPITVAPHIGGWVLNSAMDWYYLVMIFVVVFTLIAKNLVRTDFGRALVAVRDHDIAAEILGINVFRTKLLAFAVCSFFAGIAGVLWVFYIGTADMTHFPSLDSIFYVGMLIVGGMGSITGGIFGVIVFKLLDELAAYLTPILASTFPALEIGVFAALSLILYGAVIAIFVIFQPRGLMHAWETLKAYFRLWPFPY